MIAAAHSGEQDKINAGGFGYGRASSDGGWAKIERLVTTSEKSNPAHVAI